MEKNNHLVYSTAEEKTIVFETLIIDLYHKSKQTNKPLFKEKEPQEEETVSL